MPASPGSKPRVAYITTAFPWRSETAVIKELYEHHRLGFDLHIISLKRASFRGTFDPKAMTFRETTLHPGVLLLVRSLALSLHHLLFRPEYRRLVRLTLRKSGPHLAKNLYMLVLAPELARKLRAKGVSYIHANFASFQAFAAFLIHRLTGIPFGFTVHAHDIFLHPFMIPEKVRAAALVASISQFNVEYMKQHFGVTPDRLQIVHCGVDLSEFTPSPLPASSTPQILSVGRLVPMKGFDVLLEACRRLRDRMNLRCVIVGDGPEFDVLQSQIRRLDLDSSVEILRAVSQERLIQLYAECHVFVQACRRAPNGEMDGIPATLMEAMAVGRPVIASRLSGIPELIRHGCEGLLVSPEDPEELAAAIEELHQDPAKARSMGEASRSRVEAEFNIAACVKQLHERIRSIIDSTRRVA